MVTIGIIIAVWLAIGAYFGWQRAKERYVEYLDEFPSLRDAGDKGHRLDAYFAAGWTVLSWSLLGVFAGVLFVALHLWRQYLKENKG